MWHAKLLFQVGSLDDVKSSSAQADSNAAKQMALDHLGVIAARIRTSSLKVQKGAAEAEPIYRGLKSLDEVRTSAHVTVSCSDPIYLVDRL